MRSLRVRLIVGIALIAIVPLTSAMWFMAGRVRDTVHVQAEERLTGVMGLLRAQLNADLAEMRAHLDIVASDPQLERLHTLKPARGQALLGYLDEKKALIGFHALEVRESAGATSVRAEADTTGRGLLLVIDQRVEATPPFTLRGELELDIGFLDNLKRTSGVDLVLRDSAGRTWATTLDEELEPFVPLMENPDDAGLEQPSHLVRSFVMDLVEEGSPTITGLVSLADVNSTVATLRWTAILLGFGGLALAIVLGIVWSRQVSRPVQAIASFSERIARGEWDAPLEVQGIQEFGSLVEALDRMRRDLRTYRERLLAGERQAAWGVMARKVAHEIRNPLTPIAVSVADLKRSHDLGREDFPRILDQAVKTIDEEVRGLNQLLNEFAEFGRLPAPLMERVNAVSVLEDLKALYAHDVSQNRLRFTHPGKPTWLQADRAQLNQALVNLIKNGLEALVDAGRVDVALRSEDGTLVFSITDSGAGIPQERQARIFAPNFTTKEGGSGLGLTITERIVTDHGGTIRVDSRAGAGTTFHVSLPQEMGS